MVRRFVAGDEDDLERIRILAPLQRIERRLDGAPHVFVAAVGLKREQRRVDGVEIGRERQVGR